MKNRELCTIVAIIIGFLLAGRCFALEAPQSGEIAVKAPDRADTSGGHRARASELVLIGASVETPQGENVGLVEDMILDTTTGEVEYVVLSQDGACGASRLIAVPATEFKMKGLKQLEVSETKDRLDKAPSFERTDWPKIADNSWGTEVDAYYEAAAARRAGGEPKK